MIHRSLRPIRASTVDVSERPDWEQLRADSAAIRAALPLVDRLGHGLTAERRPRPGLSPPHRRPDGCGGHDEGPVGMAGLRNVVTLRAEGLLKKAGRCELCGQFLAYLAAASDRLGDELAEHEVAELRRASALQAS